MHVPPQEGVQRKSGIITYVFSDDGSKAGQPKQPSAADLVHPQAFPTEHGLAKPLSLVLLDNALRARQVAIMAHAPALVSGESDARDISQEGWAEQQLSRSCEGRVAHLTTGNELLHAELVGTLQRDGWAHGDHGSRLRAQGTAHGQLDGQNGIAVPVADTVGSAVESTHVVNDGRGAGEVAAGRGSAHQVGRVTCIDGWFLLITLRDGWFLHLLIVVLGRSGIVWWVFRLLVLLVLLLGGTVVAVIRSSGAMAHVEGQAHIRNLCLRRRRLLLLGRWWV